MTAQRSLAVAPAARWRKSRLRVRAWRLWRGLVAAFSSSLTRRIVTLNLGGLAALVAGFLLLNNLRADIVQARTQSLTTQADIIAAAVSASVAVDTDTLLVDPDKLLDPAPDASPAREEDSLVFSINPERIGPVLHRLVGPTHTRARIFDRDGELILDSQTLSPRARGKRACGRGYDAMGAAVGARARLGRRAAGLAAHLRLVDQRQENARGRRRARRQDRRHDPRQRQRRNHRLRRRADPARQCRARRARAVDARRRHRQDDRRRAVGGCCAISR